ncbi:MAG: pseudoazurin [Gammaproteobacteria bacterium]
MTRSRFLLALLTLALAGPVSAADHQVLMLNAGKDGAMVFEPGYLKVAVGDTVKFVAKDKTHNAESLLVPAGAAPFRGQVDEEIVVRIEKEGAYLYQCAPHAVMAMVGVIQAGAPANLAEFRAAVTALKARVVINKERVDKLAANVK